MAIILPAGITATEKLRHEGHTVRHHSGQRDATALQVLFVNLMPFKWVAEEQTLRLLAGSRKNVDVTLAVPDGYKSTTCPDYTLQHYEPFKALADRRFDALIVNGAPVEHLPFAQVDYIDGLKKIFEWSKTQVKSSHFICFGGFAALNHFYDVTKQDTGAKLFGVQPQHLQPVRSDLARALSAQLGTTELAVPVSRLCTVEADDVREKAPSLEVVFDSPVTGPGLIVDPRNRRLFSLNHPEYDSISLWQEYKRDIEKNPAFPRPLGYENGPPPADSTPSWRPAAQAIFTTWLHDLAQPALRQNLAATPSTRPAPTLLPGLAQA